MRFPLMAVVLLLAISAGCAVPEKMIRVGGGDAALKGFISPVMETFEEENGIPLVIVHSTPGRELVDLQQGRVDAVVSTVSLEELIKEPSRENLSVDRAALREVQIGKDRTVVFLNKGVTVRKLTKRQLKEIFTGKITNWKRVGGPNRRIVVVWNPVAGTENELFVETVLQGEPVVATFHPATGAEDVRRKVMDTPGAIGIGPRTLITPVVRVPKSPTVEATVVFVTKGEPSPKMRKLIDLLKDVAFIP